MVNIPCGAFWQMLLGSLRPRGPRRGPRRGNPGTVTLSVHGRVSHLAQTTVLTSTCVSLPLPLDLCRITRFLSILHHRPDPPSEARGFLSPPLRLPLLCPSRTHARVLVTHHLVASSL